MNHPSSSSDTSSDAAGDNDAAPSLAPLKSWSYPFPAKTNQKADADTYFKALGGALGGFYPLGSNGMWHGGIHFDAGTGRELNQASGMLAIADGEVVAYRLDNDYPMLRYPDNKLAIYATGFVLVHHKLAIPILPAESSASDDTTSVTPPGPDDVLDFYCLYMHQANWQSYLADSHMERPKFWEASGGRAFRIARADRQEAPDDDSAAAAAADATPAARLYGAHVRAEPKLVGRRYVGGDVIGFLQEGSEVRVDTIKGEGRHRWGQITRIVSGAPLSTTAGGMAPDAETLEAEGWIYLAEQVSVIEPDLDALGHTVVLSSPVPIGAGERVGHLGEYQNYVDATPLPPEPHVPIIHMEIFAGDRFPAFLAKSRAFAAQPNLPDSFKTMRLVPKGTALIAGAKQADTSVAAGLVKTPLSATDAVWVKVQPYSVGALPPGHHGNPPLTKSGSEVWVSRNDVEQSVGVEAWSDFPLNDGPAGQSTALDHVYTNAEWSKLGHVTDDQNQIWRELVTLGPDSETIHGWVSDASIAKVSPFAWPGFEIIDATAITPKDALQRQQVQQGTLFPGEAQEFKPAAEIVNNSALMQALDNAMDTDHDGKLNTQELRTAMLRPVIAQGISRIIGRYESEWGGNMARWNELTPMMRNGAPRWQKELERIEKLQIWADLKDVDGGKFPGPTVYHFHPIGLIGNFFVQADLITLEMLAAVDPSGLVSYHQQILPFLNKCAKTYKIDTPKRIAHFLSQVQVESAFKCINEDLSSYSSQRMKEVFGCKYPPHGLREARYSLDQAGDVVCTFGKLREKLWTQSDYYAGNGERLANYVYANRLGNGGEDTGDGYKYRGRGLIQITGKVAYQSFQDEHNRTSPQNHQDFVENPDLITSNLEYAVESAFTFWNNKSLNATVDSPGSTVSTVTQGVNGGQNGYIERRRAFNRVAPLLGLPED